MQESTTNKLGLGKNPRTFGLIAILIAIPICVGLVSTIQHKQVKKNTKVLAANQVNDIIVKVGKLMDLPNETPTVATVSDVTKLSGQQFFAHAQNGDKVIIFPNAKKAILYRPGTNKIIEVALYNPPVATPQASAEPSPTPTPIISLKSLKKVPTRQPEAQTSPKPTGGASPAPSSAITPTP